MALKKQIDSHKGIGLVDTFNVITSASFNEKEDEEGKKVFVVKVTVEKYLSESDYNSGENMLSVDTYDFVDSSLITGDPNSFLPKLEEKLRTTDDYAGSIIV